MQSAKFFYITILYAFTNNLAFADPIIGGTGNGTTTTAVGSGATASHPEATAIGATAEAHQTATALGHFAGARANNSIAIGANAETISQNSTVIGTNGVIYEGSAYSTALGNDTIIEARHASAMGAYSSVGSQGGTALGYEAEVTESAQNAVALGAGSRADQANTVSIGNSDTGLTRRLTNVSRATHANDAVNFQQFNEGIQETQEAAFAGIAGAAAFVQATPSQAGKTAVAVGAANYRGEQAIAISVNRRLLSGSRYHTQISGGVAYDSTDHTLSKVGVSWEF